MLREDLKSYNEGSQGVSETNSTQSPPTNFLLLLTVLLTLHFGCGVRETERPNSTEANTQAPAPKFANETRTSSPLPEQDISASKDFPTRLAKAESLFEAKAFDEAWEIAKGLLVEQPNSPPAIFIASRLMAARNNLSGAIQLIAKIPKDDPKAGVAASGQLAEWLAQSGDIPQAEVLLRSILKDYPTAVPALRLLVDVLHSQGRRWDAGKVLDRLVRLGNFTTQDLMSLVDLREPVDQEQLRRAFHTKHPEDPLSELGEIRLLLFADRWQDCYDRLETFHKSHPDQLEPWIWYGEAILETRRTDTFGTWFQSAPNGHSKHPEFWYICGRYWMQEGDWQAASKCFSEALQLDRRHLAAMQSLSECLLELNQPDLALLVRNVSGKLIRIKDLTFQLQRGQAKDDAFFEISRLYGELDDSVPSFGWEAIGLTNTKQPISEKLQAQQRELRSSKPQALPLLAKLPMDEWKIPETLTAASDDSERPERSSSISNSEKAPLVESASTIRLEDVAKEKGVLAFYHNGAGERRAWTTLEGIGGGVSALDYDRDGWPDLYYSQAGQAPYDTKQLYRSEGAKQFRPVEMLARVADRGYGQGTGVADLDQDGFDDLLVANVGVTCWYRNQGDGTFEAMELPQPAASENSIWNSAIQAADLNGDNLPDIVQCVYIDGDEFLTRKCPTPANANAMFCHPKRFPAGHTRILFNLGNGQWQLADRALLDSLVDGYALGALITNLDQRGGNDVFIANDVSPNHYLVSRPTDEQQTANGLWELSEEAVRAGVAVDLLGRAQASMGIASGDQNRDGLLDVIVTNFRYEVSTLYLQTQPGLFLDATRTARLGEPTLEWLSFGCQLSDIDNDGWLDFITVNGHIDYLDPWQMPPQVLRNRNGKFDWQKSPSPGKYFENDNVGRSLTALDWNRDGKMDFAITHLDRPTAVLENQSANSFGFLQLELIGTRSERNAIGATVEVSSGDERWVAASTVGDGFYGTNEHVIHIGIGTAKRIDRIEVRWPSGLVEKTEGVNANQRLVWIEGQMKPFPAVAPK